MARGPFQGTYQPNVRQTVVTAPDAIVYINGEVDMIGCPSCRRRFDLNKYITSVQVDLSVESVPGSASISLSIPRHTIDDFYFEGNPVITPMMEVEIYAKGFYLVEGVPQYYPIFWGLVTEVGDDYSGGEHSVSISCSDILKWWELCRMNINPAFTAPSGQQGRSIFGNVFFGSNPYDVIWSLAQSSFGDAIIGTGSLVSLYKEAGQQATFNSAFSDIMLYWEQRFRRVRSNLLLYGVNGIAVRGDSLYEPYRTGGKPNDPGHFASTAVANANGGTQGGQMVFDPSDPQVTAFHTVFSQAGQVNFWQSEYQTKLELANSAKEAIGFEFYMDVDGSIVFKPPFYNLDILSNKPLSWIQDIDIIEWNLSVSEAEVVTQLTLQGFFGGNVDYGFSEECTPFTSVTDYHLLRKYGWRPENYSSEFMGDTTLMFYHGLDILDRKNSRRHRGSVTIPFRPELRLGFPIYIAPKDQIWYITGISHNIAFGGRATTTLTLTAKREKFLAPKGIGTLKFKGVSSGAVSNPGNAAFPYSSRTLSNYGSYDLQVGTAATVPPVTDIAPGAVNPYEPLIMQHPKTGRILGYPNAVMVYTRPFKTSPDQLKKDAGIKTTPNPNSAAYAKKEGENYAKRVDETTSSFMTDSIDELRAKHSNNRYQYGLNSAGVYVYAYEKEKTIGELVLLPAKNVHTTDATGADTKVFEGSTGMIRPVSDERGFEVIGHFRYGRGVALRDGQLVYNSGERNKAANVDVQLALSGGLFETLQAQSQGITALISAYANPADALARLQPEDLQTAGVQNPDSKDPDLRMVTSSVNFVDSAPLGSPEAQGLPSSVEASQLSKALTIAELTVKDGNTIVDTDCACILGRSDLAFISTGYQVQVLTPASPAPALYDGKTVGLVGVIAGDTATAAALNEARGIGVGLGAAPSISDAVPVTGALLSPSREEVIKRVDLFLVNLYTALDGPHQALEQRLRDGGIALTPGEVDGSTADTGTPYGDLTPPFSEPDRYALGDTKATLGNASTAIKDIGNAWSSFGSNLKNNAKKTQLSQDIANEQQALQRYKSDKAQLEQQAASGTTIAYPSLPDQIAALDKKIASTQQDIANKQAELSQLG
jgi:hypothetical protein